MELEKLAYKTEEACEILGINRNLLDSFRKNGLLQTIKVGRYYIYPKSELERFINKNIGNEITKDGTILSENINSWERIKA